MIQNLIKFTSERTFINLKNLWVNLPLMKNSKRVFTFVKILLLTSYVLHKTTV